MSSIQLAFLCLSGMIVLMGLRVPIAVALGITSFVGIWALRGLDTALKLSGSTPFEFAASWNLSAIPISAACRTPTNWSIDTLAS